MARAASLLAVAAATALTTAVPWAVTEVETRSATRVTVASDSLAAPLATLHGMDNMSDIKRSDTTSAGTSPTEANSRCKDESSTFTPTATHLAALDRPARGTVSLASAGVLLGILTMALLKTAGAAAPATPLDDLTSRAAAIGIATGPATEAGEQQAGRHGPTAGPHVPSTPASESMMRKDGNQQPLTTSGAATSEPAAATCCSNRTVPSTASIPRGALDSGVARPPAAAAPAAKPMAKAYDLVHLVVHGNAVHADLPGPIFESDSAGWARA